MDTPTPASIDFAVRLCNMMDEADRSGYHATARLINEATRKLGWEIADKISKGKEEKAR